MALTYFTAVGRYMSFSGHQTWDNDALSPVTGTVVFSPMIKDGRGVKATLPQPTSLVLQPVQAVIRNGEVTRNNAVGCPLVANTADLNLPGDLYYRVSFVDVHAGDGEPVDLNEFTFLAPTTAVTVDLATVAPAPDVEDKP